MRAAIILVSILLLSITGYSATYYIPGDYGTIREAIDASVHGDTLIVLPGTYYENIDFMGKAITLKSEQGAAETIIDGAQAGSVVTCISVEGPDTVMEGFTICNGSANNGGGMYNEGTSPTVIQCTFQGNSAYAGGGMCYRYSLSPMVVDCTFHENSADWGGGMYIYSSSPTVTQCAFQGNSANCYGGGICTHEFSSPTVTQCTFQGNSATLQGGGIEFYTASPPTVTNCILWNDTPDEIHIQLSTPVVTYSCIQGGYTGAGNIDSDPLFSDPTSLDFHLLCISPCIDAGDNNTPILPEYDFEGEDRIMDGDKDGIAIVDMGIDEFLLSFSSVWVDDDWSGLSPGDPVGGGYIFGCDAFDKIQDGIDGVATTGTVHVADGTYTGEKNRNLDFHGRALTCKSENGPSACIIDCEQFGRGFYFHNGEGSDSWVEGFTIYNGSAYYGGGMCNESSSPTVKQCTFLLNLATEGGGMHNDTSSPTVTQCTFQDNTVDSHGGGMNNYSSSSPTVTDCIFVGNSANAGGGVVNGSSSSPTVIDCTFQGNTADAGGGMANWGLSSPMVIDCIFQENMVEYNGGGMANVESSPTVTRCTFQSNSSNSTGGGMLNASCSPTVTECTFQGNSASSGGGGMFNYDTSATIINCTFQGNSASSVGGGIFNWDATPTVTNSILWNDTPDEIYNDSSSPAITYCCIQGGYTGAGNIDSDPLFLDPANHDLHLTSGSPCIDSGDNNAPSIPDTDFEGDPRFFPGNGKGFPIGTPHQGAVVDMGVDEYCLLKKSLFIQR